MDPTLCRGVGREWRTSEYSCRGGSCRTCRTWLISGQVHHLIPLAKIPAEGDVLICCAMRAVSADGSASLEFHL